MGAFEDENESYSAEVEAGVPPPLPEGARLPPGFVARRETRIRGPYSLAVEWWRSVPGARPWLSVSRAGDLDRIAHMGDAWGKSLDAAGATEEMLRWVAGAHGDRWVAQREARYLALRKLLAEHGSERGIYRRFLALKASMPKVGRWAGR